MILKHPKMMNWNVGEMTLLHVPMEHPLTTIEQQSLRPILTTWGFPIPTSWDDPDTDNIHGVYLEVVQGYTLDHSMTKQPLKDAFLPHEPVEQYVNILETYDALTQDVQKACNRSDIQVARCRVGYVSME